VEYLKGEDVSSVYITSKESSIASAYPCFEVVEPMQTSNSPLSVNGQYIISPTIVADYFEVKGNIAPVEIRLFDFTGKLLIHISNESHVNTSKLPKGIYQVVIRNSDNQVYRSKIIKQA
jgi:hypothetical protein